MKIISGTYKGRNIKGFDIDGTRPTMNRVKESLFAMIQERINGSVCLDLFAGSGNLGIEALSNGAKDCYFVDHKKEAVKVILDNCEALKVPNPKVFQMDFHSALLMFQKEGIQFDLIFLDPPYNENMISSALQKIKDYNLLKENGLVVCEFEKEMVISPFSLWKERTYGSKHVKIYEN